MSETRDDNEPGYGWIVSLLFWPCLLLSAAAFAAVALAPKYKANLELRREFYDRQVRLVRLEQEVLYLEKVADALEHDPHFAAEQARVELDAARPGEERIPVDPDLYLDRRVKAELGDVPEFKPPWHALLVEIAATDHHTRRNLLAIAAVLIVAAFAFLHEGQVHSLFATARSFGDGARKVWGGILWAAGRYRTQEPAHGPSIEGAFRPTGPRKPPKYLKTPAPRKSSRS